MSNQVMKYNKTENSFVTLEGGLNEMTPELIRNSILGLEKAMQGLPSENKMALETMHTFSDGLYVRTVFMKAGSLITGKIHKKEHVVIVSQGQAQIVSEDAGSKFICSPMIFVSPPLVKRLLFIQQDMIFTTVHKNLTNTRDTEELERELMLPSYELLQGEKA